MYCLCSPSNGKRSVDLHYIALDRGLDFGNAQNESVVYSFEEEEEGIQFW